MSAHHDSQDYARLYYLAKRGETGELLAFLANLRGKHIDDEAEGWALVSAAEANQLATVAALLDRGVSPNRIGNRSHIQPLWKAAKRGHLEVVKLLVAKGADVSFSCDEGMTARDYASRYSHHEVEDYLASIS
ncbi:ankyrin repeat domain-containing protein [Variovorax sp. CY25R-8]|jgi:ankyrin repeat protein|uniref:ankyrin repeat domain-containing protein n=1 Tax=Variovorax sp. CY25R-8 TaxID=2855501 RepID=UPI0021BA4A83|nr:ankyrin repeat domain-containing protein [Variovorax sp. CY25R-8]MCT8173942.1 ankyrin repeat domain-containing protein [Variovorax sp. CY25R-8]